MCAWIVAISVLKDGKGRNRRFQSLPSSEIFSSFLEFLYGTVDLLTKEELTGGYKKVRGDSATIFGLSSSERGWLAVFLVDSAIFHM